MIHLLRVLLFATALFCYIVTVLCGSALVAIIIWDGSFIDVAMDGFGRIFDKMCDKNAL